MPVRNRSVSVFSLCWLSRLHAGADVQYDAAGAFFHAFAAGGALVIVDSGKIVGHVYGVVLADFFAHPAGNAAHVAVFADDGFLSTELQGTVILAL